jgi:HK97 gp10 family phage protein
LSATHQHIRVDGLAELERRLQQLEPKIARRYGYRATAAGAAVIRDEARRQAVFVHGFSEGLIRKNIMQFRPRRGRDRRMAAEIDVGVRLKGSRKKRRALGRQMRRKGAGGSERSAFPAYYWFMVEFGTAKMAAQPFLRPAFEQKKHEAVQVVAATLGASLDAMAK